MARTLPCDTCGAQPGETCISESGDSGYTKRFAHLARRQAAGHRLVVAHFVSVAAIAAPEVRA